MATLTQCLTLHVLVLLNAGILVETQSLDILFETPHHFLLSGLFGALPYLNIPLADEGMPAPPVEKINHRAEFEMVDSVLKLALKQDINALFVPGHPKGQIYAVGEFASSEETLLSLLHLESDVHIVDDQHDAQIRERGVGSVQVNAELVQVTFQRPQRY